MKASVGPLTPNTNTSNYLSAINLEFHDLGIQMNRIKFRLSFNILRDHREVLPAPLHQK